MISRLKIGLSSKPWFWRLRTSLEKIVFAFERSTYKNNSSITNLRANVRILGSFAWIGTKSLFWVFLALAALSFTEKYVSKNLSWPPPLSADNKEFNLEQLRLYAQLLTGIFSIYFATIGIILSSGYTKLRRDIIQMLTNEQVGSVYSKVLVLTAIFCLVATAFSSFGFEPGLFVYTVGTILTLLSTLALFPLGQRLFNFFDLNLLVRSEILPSLARHIEGASKPRNSFHLSNHYSTAARQSLEQLFYIDNRVKTDKDSLEDNLTALSDDYTTLLLHYLNRKHLIDQQSYWFPRRKKYKQWFLAGDSATFMALQMSHQQSLVEEQLDYYWFENEILKRLAGHIELAFQVGDFELALNLIGRFSTRISVYATRFQFDIGMEELKKIQGIIELAFHLSNDTGEDNLAKVKIGIADAWAAMGSNLCLQTLRRMIVFETELKRFFEADEWSKKSLRRLPAFLQSELALIVERIEFEQEIEGQRLSKPKYVQQLAIQKLLQHYAKVLPTICDFYLKLLPSFVATLTELKMSEAATQIVLASLHSHWKLPGHFDELAQLVGRYGDYMHYTEKLYALPDINIAEMSDQLASAREDAIATLGNAKMVSHILQSKHNDDLPDHFGQIYFELAEASISALEQNNENMLNRVLPMFFTLAFLAADSKFMDTSLDINAEFRFHLISTVINDLASVLGFSILYGAFYDNEKLSESALAKFDNCIEQVTDKQQYLKKMVILSNPHSFGISTSPRSQIRFNWKTSFENRLRCDGFGDQMRMGGEKQHPNKLVRVFLESFSHASHLFFAKQIIPQLGQIDFEIDHQITSLASKLCEDDKEVRHEDF